MKRLFLILFVVVSLNLDAQYVTNFAKNVNTKEVDGFYYHLPRNIVRLDFIVEKQQDLKGKYNSFAKEMLGTDNYIKENKTSYKIKGVNVSTLTEADPDYVFFISVDEKNKENLNFNIELTSDGIIHSFGYKITDSENSQNVSFNEDVCVEETLSEYNYISIRDDEEDSDDLITDMKVSEKEIAASIIEEIKNIRLAYFDLITGYQEVNYGSTINYMADELKKLENEYISLFLGKTHTTTFTETFYIIPEEGKNVVSLSRFSLSDGFNSKTGDNVKINFVDTSIGSNVNKLSKDDIENSTYSNKLFYRNPANVTMQIVLGDDKIFENRLKINQFVPFKVLKGRRKEC